MIFGSITTGASNDIEQATKLTRSMITRYGMSRKFDMVALETVTNQYLSGDTALACSAETAAKIDEEVIATVKTAHEKAIGILQNNMDALHRLAHFLLEKETITGEEFMDLCIRANKESLSRCESFSVFEWSKLKMSLSCVSSVRAATRYRALRDYLSRPSGGLIHFPFHSQLFSP